MVMSSIYFESNSKLSVTGRERRDAATSDADASMAPLAMPGLIIGLLLVGLGLAALVRLGDWVGDYGPVLVGLAYVMYLGAAGWLLCWSALTVRSLHRH